MEEYLRQFINRHQDRHAPFKSSAFTLKSASIAFGEPQEVLKKMSRKDFARLYRLKALKLHPDKGGDNDEFVHLTDAYHALLKTKK